MRKALPLLLVFIFALAACAASPAQEGETVHIAMPAPRGMTDAQTNYYRLWLEEQSGLGIELELIPPDYMAEYMRLLLAGSTGTVDGVFFDPAAGRISRQEVEQWGKEGRILPLEAMAGAESANLNALIRDFAPYDLGKALTADDGHMYYMPNLQYSNVLRNTQIMWINTDWLKQTGLSIPQTTQELRAVLRAFSEGDPNGNGKADELPVAFCTDEESQLILCYLMNAFVYCDPENAYMAVENGQVYFTPTTQQWRQGLIYCRELYQEGLLPEACFSFTQKQLVRAVSDSRDLAGGFVSESIDDVLMKSSTELYSKYMYIPPLEGEGSPTAPVKSFTPRPGGVITSRCQNPEAVFAVMDLMLSEEAYLIAAFGEQGVDWDFSQPNEISLSGSSATVTVKSREWDIPANKHFSSIGPFVTYPEYGDGVAWNGYQSDQRYLTARAARIYQDYEPREYIGIMSVPALWEPVKAGIERFVHGAMCDFVTGVRDPLDDRAWAAYLAELDGLEADALTAEMQRSYEAFRKDNP